MNGDYGESRLPELADEDVAVLYRICKVATRSNTSANNAIFSSYNRVFEDLERDTRHDNAIFRWITRLARVDDARLERRPDFVARLRALLENEHGITVVDEEETKGEHVVDVPAVRRRSSFDDAQYEETWLSNHTQSIDGARPGRNVRFSNHVRAISHDAVVRLSRDPAQPSTDQTFEHGYSMEELEDWADGVFHTTDTRLARRCLRKWHNVTFSMINENLGRQMIAAHHDRQLLQKQAWEIWREAFAKRQEEHQFAFKEQDCEERLTAALYLAVKRSIWKAWRAHLEDVKAVEEPPRQHILRLRYFGRWKAIALENQGKVKSILLRKYAGRWMDAVDILAARSEQARDTYVHSLLRQCLSIWADRVNARRQKQRHEDDLARQAIRTWRRAVHNTRRSAVKAAQVNRQQQCRAVFLALSESLQQRCAQEAHADRVRDSNLLTKAMTSLKRHASTFPALQQVRSAKRQRTKQDILSHWRQCTKEHQQAVQHDRVRLLKHSLQAWNDALRIRTLDLRLNERVKAQTLYKLLLEERSRQCARMIDSRRMRLCWVILRTRSGDAATNQQRRIAHFDGELQRRRMSQAVQCLHLESRKRDDAERAAVEFRNGRILPRVWRALSTKTAHSARLNTWSRDAAFFVATKKTIKTWRAKTEHSKQDKRHQAYVKFRSSIKARLVQGAWNAMQAKMELFNDAQVASFAHLEVADEANVKNALSTLRRRSTRCKDMREVAAKHDRSVTARAAFGTLMASHDNLIELDAQAEDMRFDVDSTTQAMVLKRLRFAAFALARLQENSTVYQKRHREQHARQMLRHLVHTMTERQSRRQEEPDSPSLRPASRAAARPDDDTTFLQSARRTTGTPAYLKTPSRARRSKLRTIPTPAPFTPFAFTPGFLASTPGPSRVMVDATTLDATTLEADDTLPQITPFNRRLRASGINTDLRPASILRSRRQLGASLLATDKSVRFAGASRLQGGRAR